MKKFPAIQVILVVLLVGVIALGFVMTKKKPVKEVDNRGEVTTSGSTESVTESLYEAEQRLLQEKMDSYASYNAAVDALDITACEKITGNDALKLECIDNVYAAMASKGKNGALCEKIQNTETKAHCANSFIYDTVLASGKQSDCEKIVGDSELQNACAKNIVFAQIENQSFSGTADVCSTLSGADKDYCMNRIEKDADIDLLQKGTTTKDVKICGQIQDVGMKNTCNDTVYMTLALEQKNASLCIKIVDTARKTTCTAQLSRVNDASILQKALSENSLALCATITTPEFKTKCSDTLLLKQGVANKDTATCTKITDTATRKQCTDAVKLIIEQTSK